MDHFTLMSRFAPESRYGLVRDFIEREGLFGKLNVYIKLRLR